VTDIVKLGKKKQKKRGLSNLKTTPDALKVLISNKAIALFEEMNVLNKREVEAKYEVELEQYVMKMLIEAGVLSDLTMNHIVPSALKYQQELVQVIKGLKEIYNQDYKKYAKEPLYLLNELSGAIVKVSELVRKLRKNLNKINEMELEKQADVLAHQIKPEFDKIRQHTDKLEMMIDDKIWPLTKYREMLFIR
jgi:glutamine synthetase